MKAAPKEVASLVAAADLGIAFRTPTVSQQAVAPIKVGEYLLCGVPVLSTRGIGDLDAQLGPSEARLISSLSDADLRAAARWLLKHVLPNRAAYRHSCRQAGIRHFALDRSVEEYRAAFQLLR